MKPHEVLPHPLTTRQLYINLPKPQLRALVDLPRAKGPPSSRLFAHRTSHKQGASARTDSARKPPHTPRTSRNGHCRIWPYRIKAAALRAAARRLAATWLGLFEARPAGPRLSQERCAVSDAIDTLTRDGKVAYATGGRRRAEVRGGREHGDDQIE